MRREDVERLYEQHGPALLAFACAVLGHRAAAEDVVQQVFLKLLRGDAAVPDDPRAYLYRAVRNASLNARRLTSREVALDPDCAWFLAPTGAPEEALALQAALEQLPDEQREIIVMKLWGGLTLEEAATVLEISPNTAASRYRYGLEKLRLRLQPVNVRVHATRK
jgi:RNA polymerase sigma-70 factor, ECF subfamily